MAKKKQKCGLEYRKHVFSTIKQILVFHDLDEYSNRQDRAFRNTFNSNEQSFDRSLSQASKQKAARKNLSIKPAQVKSKIDHLSANSEDYSALNPLMARGIEIDNKVSKFSRESASRKQSKTTVEQHYQEWSKNNKSNKSSAQLFDKHGKKIKRVEGEE